MPPDLWNVPVRNGTINTLALVRPIAAADWERPLFYLHRVKTFNASSAEELPSPELFERLSSACPRERLFPNLRILTWSHKESAFPGLYPHIRAVLGPRLKQLDIRIPLLASDLPLFRNIASESPELADVESGGEHLGSDYGQQFMPNVSVFIRGLNRIQKLYIASFAVDGRTLQHLATTPTFKSLHLGGFEHEGLACRLSQPSDGPRFTQLTHLRVFSISVEAASDIFLCRPPLAHIDIRIFPVASIQAISALYDTMAENVPPRALCSLTIFNTQLRGGFSPLPLAFPPLLAFHNLKTVTLYNDCAFALDDGIVHQMACAWPNIQFLALISRYPQVHSDPPRVTLAALCSLAEHCPALSTLGIDINALVVPLLDDFAFLRPALVTLEVGYAPIKNPSAVADFISAVFPNLTPFVTAFWLTSATSLTPAEEQQLRDRWDEVKQLLAQKRRTSS
ncbi:hypothetical protein C8R47DRAFT_1205607 [Mycena vitilis]|nr:hypothetical protein C8R47DRAFT_1205607 [Mycena vitilis]